MARQRVALTKRTNTPNTARQRAKVKLRMLISPQNMLLANQGKLVSRQASPLRRSTSTFQNSQTSRKRRLCTFSRADTLKEASTGKDNTIPRFATTTQNGMTRVGGRITTTT